MTSKHEFLNIEKAGFEPLAKDEILEKTVGRVSTGCECGG